MPSCIPTVTTTRNGCSREVVIVWGQSSRLLRIPTDSWATGSSTSCAWAPSSSSSIRPSPGWLPRPTSGFRCVPAPTARLPLACSTSSSTRISTTTSATETWCLRLRRRWSSVWPEYPDRQGRRDLLGRRAGHHRRRPHVRRGQARGRAVGPCHRHADRCHGGLRSPSADIVAICGNLDVPGGNVLVRYAYNSFQEVRVRASSSSLQEMLDRRIGTEPVAHPQGRLHALYSARSLA